MSKMAIAYNLRKKKNKDKKKDSEKGARKENHAYNYDQQHDMKGVNKVLPRYDREKNRISHGQSQSNWEGATGESKKDRHKKVLAELIEMAAPKLKGMADGGMAGDKRIAQESMRDAFGYKEKAAPAPEHEEDQHKETAKYEVLKPGSTAYAHGGCVNCGYSEGGEVDDWYAKGGKVDHPGRHAKGWTHDKDYNEGVHREVSEGGKSYVGELVRKGFSDRAKDRQKSQMAHNKKSPKPKLKGLYEGGEVEDKMLKPSMGESMHRESGESKAHEASEISDIVDRIMEKRAMYSEGGKVANDTGTGEVAKEMPNQFDDLVLRDDLESDYDGSNAGDFKGNEQESDDRKDIVSRIMASRRKKDRNPRPA